MINFESALKEMAQLPELEPWVTVLPAQLDALLNKKNGNMPRWLPALNALPTIQQKSIELNSAAVTVSSDADEDEKKLIETELKKLMPWRKGPFSIHGVEIDTEWHSDWKWQRVKDQIQPLTGRKILDVGCGSGYHCWRMLGEGAELVIGVDPSLLFLMQFRAIKHFLGENHPVHLLPVGIQDVPAQLRAFDTVFSMGVLYHRKSPIDHLYQLRDCLVPGGELVLETLVIEGGLGEVLMPEDRYAQMRNVWFLPSCDTMLLWLRRSGFKNVRLLDVNQTTVEEQRKTEWMQFDSLSDYLDPNDHDLTVEGYPAPRRAVFSAVAP